MNTESIRSFGLARIFGFAACGLAIVVISFFSTLWVLDRVSAPQNLQPFALGSAVLARGNTLVLSGQNGQKIELLPSDPAKPSGAAEGLSSNPDGSLNVTGWAVVLDEKAPAQYVVAISNGHLAAWTEPNLARTDIAGGLGATYSRSGFVLQLPKLSQPEIKSLRIYSVSKSATGRELGYSPALR